MKIRLDVRGYLNTDRHTDRHEEDNRRIFKTFFEPPPPNGKCICDWHRLHCT